MNACNLSRVVTKDGKGPIQGVPEDLSADPFGKSDHHVRSDRDKVDWLV
jgi:hypothetical protein